MAWHPSNIASAEVTGKIRRIEPSHDVYGALRPCRATTARGGIIDRLLMVEEAHGLSGEVDVHDVVDVVEHPRRLPARFATQLHLAGESGMGYIVYTVQLQSGETLVVVSGNVGIDFPDLPSSISPCDIVAVLPHVGRDRVAKGDYVRDAPFRICCYVPFPG